jgi:hypothetical protein
MSTRIFSVEFWYGESIGLYKSQKTVVAKDALDAINKAKKFVESDPEHNYDWEPEDAPGEKAHTALVDFDPVNVTLEAEAD